MIQALLEWAAEHSHLLAAISAISLIAFAGTLFAAPMLIARMPCDYFSREQAPSKQTGVLRFSLGILRNLAGTILMGIGLIMLVTPGPGLIVFLLGLSICAFPGKHQLMSHMAAYPKVFMSLNWIRQKRGQKPFVHPSPRTTL